jgi:prepilin-type N-terminal cleavage/methylation domain-containing protein
MTRVVRSSSMSQRRGFTLLEVMVGLAIIAALVGALSGFLVQLSDARARLTTTVERVECADAVFSLVDRALATAVVADPQFGAGVGGNESTLRVVRSGVGLGQGDAPLFADRERCEVRMLDGAGRIEIARGDRRDIVDVPVRALRIRYLSERGWRDAFDSSEDGAFPVGIEVSIWFGEETPANREMSSDEVLDVRGTLASETLTGAPDRRRFFRIAGAPRVDPLARRAITSDEESRAQPKKRESSSNGNTGTRDDVDTDDVFEEATP